MSFSFGSHGGISYLHGQYTTLNPMRTIDNQFQKYVWLLNTLLRHPDGISLHQMDELWMASTFSDGEHLSRTTFNRYRDNIQEMFSVTIGCRRVSTEYHYYLLDSDPLHNNTPQTWLLRTMSVSGALQNSRSLQQRIILEEMPGGQEYLQTVIDAMTHSHRVRITYHPFGRSVGDAFTVAPYCLKVFRQRWYIAGHSSAHPDDYVRVYALDRVEQLEETEQSFILPSDFDAESLFAEDFGVMRGGELQAQTIVIRAHGSLVWYLRTLPLHASQQEVLTGDGWSDFRYRLRPTYDFRQELLSQAAQIEILSPQSLKEEFCQVLRESLAKHEYHENTER